MEIEWNVKNCKWSYHSSSHSDIYSGIYVNGKHKHGTTI